MMTYCSNAWTDFADWTQETPEQNSEELNHTWNYYLHDRVILHGLPLALISAVAAAYLFKCAAPVKTGIIFGLTNYLLLTSLAEIIRAHHDMDQTQACVLVAISGALSFAFVRTLCKTALTYQAAAVLTTAAFAGQLTRLFFLNEES